MLLQSASSFAFGTLFRLVPDAEPLRDTIEIGAPELNLPAAPAAESGEADLNSARMPMISDMLNTQFKSAEESATGPSAIRPLLAHRAICVEPRLLAEIEHRRQRERYGIPSFGIYGRTDDAASLPAKLFRTLCMNPELRPH
jgi:hypothetical protein